MPLSNRAQTILTDTIQHWQSSHVHVVYSHDLQVERVAYRAGKCVTSAGITAYQGVVGNIYGERFTFPLGDAYTLSDLEWWDDSLWQTPLAQGATLHYLKQFAHLLGKADIHHKRLVGAYQQKFIEAQAKVQSQLQSIDLRLEHVYHLEPEEYLDAIPTNDGVILSLLAPDASQVALDQLLNHHPRKMTEERIEALCFKVIGIKEWLIISPDTLPMKDYLKGMAQSDSGACIYFYSNAMPTRLTMPHFQYGKRFFEPVLDRPITSLELQPITGADLNTLRAKYLAHGTPIGLRTQGTVNGIAVVSGDYLLGAFGIAHRVPNYANYRNLGIKTPVAYLTTDFAIHPTHYSRLGKLICAAALTQESKAWMEHSLSQLVQSVATTAFSEHPVSMKYRGLFKLLRRLQEKEGDPYTLIYASEFRQWSLADALSWWQSQHGGTDEG